MTTCVITRGRLHLQSAAQRHRDESNMRQTLDSAGVGTCSWELKREMNNWFFICCRISIFVNIHKYYGNSKIGSAPLKILLLRQLENSGARTAFVVKLKKAPLWFLGQGFVHRTKNASIGTTRPLWRVETVTSLTNDLMLAQQRPLKGAKAHRDESSLRALFAASQVAVRSHRCSQGCVVSAFAGIKWTKYIWCQPWFMMASQHLI